MEAIVFHFEFFANLYAVFTQVHKLFFWSVENKPAFPVNVGYLALNHIRNPLARLLFRHDARRIEHASTLKPDCLPGMAAKRLTRE